MTDLIGGTLPVLPVVVPLASQHVTSGRAKALAVLDGHRSALLPDVPAITEEPMAEAYSPTPVWYGFVAPAKTPPAVVQTLAGMIADAMKSSELQAKLQAQGAQAVTVSNEQFAIDLKSEYEKASALPRRLGVTK
jgi:tripartite-type tricarboxylate transporter receptor subunit TctC